MDVTKKINLLSGQGYTQVPVNHRAVLRASFRGRPLVGDKLELPKQYYGIVIQEQKQPLTESTERTAHVTHAFKSIVYWNWAKQPSKNDAFISMLDWIDIAEVLHTSDGGCGHRIRNEK